jgi:hypothetical protein
MSTRATVHLPDASFAAARDVREAVLAWASDRPHLAAPEVVHVAAPASVDADPEADFTPMRRWCLVTLTDPTVGDVAALRAVLRPWATSPAVTVAEASPATA